MEKLPLLVHGKPITDQGGEDDVGAGHRLLFSSSQADYDQEGQADDAASHWKEPLQPKG